MRALLALAASIVIVVLGSGCDAKYSRDSQPEPPCYRSKLKDCLEAQDDLESISGDCSGREQRVCLAPLGKIDYDLVEGLVSYFEDRYDLALTVLAPAPVPKDLLSRDRIQFEASDLVEQMETVHPGVYADSSAVMIGLTPLDIYIKDENWRFAFGVRGDYSGPKGVISTFRMNLYSKQELAGEQLVFARIRKMVERYVGQLYYGLELNDDPESPLYHTILGLTDLDRIEKRLPLAPAGGS